MTEQLSFLETPIPDPPHRGGSTQIEAAKKIRKCAGSMERQVLDAIVDLQGATNDELVAYTGIKLQTVCARVWVLREHLGLIEDSGERRLTRSKRKAIVWTKTQTPKGGE